MNEKIDWKEQRKFHIIAFAADYASADVCDLGQNIGVWYRWGDKDDPQRIRDGRKLSMKAARSLRDSLNKLNLEDDENSSN